MKVYDPADFIVYVTMDTTQVPLAAPATVALPDHRLPGGYAKEFPRTRLRSSKAARPLASRSGRQPPAGSREPVDLEDALMALRAAPGGERLLSPAAVSTPRMGVR
jgi:hypothetical protein